MKTSKPTYTMQLSEEELKLAVSFYLDKVHNQQVEITHLKHVVGERTEGYGMQEIDIPYQKGIKIRVQDV